MAKIKTNLLFLVLSFILNPLFINSKKKEKKPDYSFLRNIVNDESDEIKVKHEREDNPKISVLITQVNNRDFILNTLKSVQNQTLEELEIIVTEENTYNNYYKTLEAHAIEDKRIKIVRNLNDKSILYIRSELIKMATGKYIFMLNQGDIISDVNALKQIYEAAEKEDADLVHFQSIEGNIVKRWIRVNLQNKPIANSFIIQPELKHYFPKNFHIMTINNKLFLRQNLVTAITKLGEAANTNLFIFEDLIYLMLYCQNAKKYIPINYPFVWINKTNEEANIHKFYNEDLNKQMEEIKIKYLLNVCDVIALTYDLSPHIKQEKVMFNFFMKKQIERKKIPFIKNHQILKERFMNLCGRLLKVRFVEDKKYLKTFCVDIGYVITTEDMLAELQEALGLMNKNEKQKLFKKSDL